MKKYLVFLSLAVSIGLQAQTVKIAAASSLRIVLEEIVTRYKEINPGVKIILNLGASGVMVQQISNGGDFDLFMSADRSFPEMLKSRGLAHGEVRTYAKGRLVLWSNTLDVSKGLEVLTGKSVNRIAIANPALAPYGDRAVQCLKNYKLYDKIRHKLVYADNIAQAALFAQTGNAEVGIIAYSLVLSPDMKGSFFLPEVTSYKPVEQALVLIKDPKINPEAVNFVKFVTSKACWPIFEKYGFILP